MRLLHTKDMSLREFSDADDAPPYAILSHVWCEQEVLFTHMQNPQEAQNRLGFSKVLKCCEKVRAAGYDWVWIDTCCIDKASSAELSEAINSMFAWYKKARVCYAYLDDVAPGGLPPRHDFEHSRWFTRGWTLQELIAPAQVMFLAQDWSEIGTRGELVESIEHVTRVDSSVLLGRPVQLGVAQIMSWAANRSTTRVEDRAYSLMGLFDISMPTIYGEEERAFVRLQQEILRRSTDHSIFAWTGDGMRGVLAPSPACFRPSAAYSEVRRVPYVEFARMFPAGDPLPEYTITNHGIRIKLPVREYRTKEGAVRCVAALACQKWVRLSNGRREPRKVCGLRLHRIEGTTDQYQRMGLLDLDITKASHFREKEVYLIHDSHDFDTLGTHQEMSTFVFLVSPRGLSSQGLSVSALIPEEKWKEDDEGRLCLTIDASYDLQRCGVAVLRDETTGARLAMVLGMQHSQEKSWNISVFALMMDLLVDDGTGIWATLPTDSTSDSEAATSIWRQYRGDTAATYQRFLQSSKQFFQRSQHFGTGFIHMTVEPSYQPGDRQWINTVELYAEMSPHRRGWDLVWLLGAILGHLRGPDTGSVARHLQWEQFDWYSPERILFTQFLDDGGYPESEGITTVPLSRFPEAIRLKETPIGQLWGTYEQKVLFHKSERTDSNDETVAKYHFGNKKLRMEDFLQVAAYFGQAYRLACEQNQMARNQGQGERIAGERYPEYTLRSDNVYRAGYVDIVWEGDEGGEI